MTAPRVVVVGSVNVDLVVRLPRLPSPGETAGGGVFAVNPGGKGGNQAVAAARLGADVVLVAALGDDDHGRDARADLEREGVDTSLIETADAATGIAVVLVDETAENLIALAPGANAALAPDAVTAALTGLPDGPAVVLASLEVPHGLRGGRRGGRRGPGLDVRAQPGSGSVVAAAGGAAAAGRRAHPERGGARGGGAGRRRPRCSTPGSEPSSSPAAPPER